MAENGEGNPAARSVHGKRAFPGVCVSDSRAASNGGGKSFGCGSVRSGIARQSIWPRTGHALYSDCRVQSRVDRVEAGRLSTATFTQPCLLRTRAERQEGGLAETRRASGTKLCARTRERLARHARGDAALAKAQSRHGTA